MQAFTEYLASLRKNLAQGDSTEHTHRAALQRLVEAVSPGVFTVNEAQRIACGAPDLTLRRGTTPLAHIETKDIGTPLDEVRKGRGAHGKQFKRYLDGLPNWLLTDYLRFDWFVAGEFRKTVLLATLDANGKLHPITGGAEELEHLLTALVEPNVQTVKTARELAERMAGITHLLREAIDQSFASGSHDVITWLSQWLASFRETLIPELKTEEFADMFAQTLAYGLFAARIQTSKTGGKFSHAEALLAVPKSNPFLRKIFSEMAGADMPSNFKWAVDDLVRLLEMADIGAILKNFGKQSGQNDPIVHFYETFLAAYDPKLRQKRGVYYTPEPVVRYIVRSVDSLLKTHFNKPKGLADEKTLILDPATGTATFLYEVIAQIRESMKGQEGAWPGYVRDHLLKRIFGFELLMAPYAIAHLKLGLELEQTGYKFAEGERLGIYLTNTLEEAAKKSERIIAKAISDEADSAAAIKRELPIMVVLGNPPYSGISANRSEVSRDLKAGDRYYIMRGNALSATRTRVEKTARRHMTIKEKTFIGQLLDDYKQIDGVPLGEKKQWTNNDYVKFIRFAQWRLEQSGFGILAYITDNSYLNAPTLRGLRRSLMGAFDHIYILDLHGKSKKKEKTPEGGKDENVFDIQQGVSILLAIRQRERTGTVSVMHAEMWGDRTEKYSSLDRMTLASTTWQQVTPSFPAYEFIPPPNESLPNKEDYAGFFSTQSMFISGSNGVQTSRDSLVTDFSRSMLKQKIASLRDHDLSDEELRLKFFGGSEPGKYAAGDSYFWNLHEARRRLLVDTSWEDNLRAYLYRPMDTRYIIYTDYLVHRRRRTVFKQLDDDNIMLCVGRSGSVTSGSWSLAFCVDAVCDHNLFFRGSSLNSPLYLYPDRSIGTSGDFFSERRLNLARPFLDRIAAKLGLRQDERDGLPEGITAREIFGYIYSILYAPAYRSRYEHALGTDFPRVPLTSSLDLFRALAEKGRRLVSLHLLKIEDAPQLDSFITTFPVSGLNEVSKVKYDSSKQQVAINDDQYFAGLPEPIWSFHIGGYQVLEKWLKDRKGRTLTFDDIQHWQRTAVALNETETIMQEIDALIPSWPLV